MGGEYGGAATYVAERAPHNRRGEYTAWIQTTATLGLFLSLINLTGANFDVWGWRIPFLVSIVLLFVSIWSAEEFKTIDLGDKRLNNRAFLFAEQLAVKPTASIPTAC